MWTDTSEAETGRPGRVGLSERQRLDPQDKRHRRRASRPMPKQSPEGDSELRAKVDVTIRNSLRKMPNGGKPAMASTPITSAPAERRMAGGQAADVGYLLRSLDWAPWPTAKKIADLVRQCIVMCSRPAKLAIGPPMPKAKVMIPICSIDE